MFWFILSKHLRRSMKQLEYTQAIGQIQVLKFQGKITWHKIANVKWTASSEFGTNHLCELRRFRRVCASAQSRQNLRCSLIQAVSQEEPSDRKPDHWPLWMAGHAQLKFVMTECSKSQIRLTGLKLYPDGIVGWVQWAAAASNSYIRQAQTKPLYSIHRALYRELYYGGHTSETPCVETGEAEVNWFIIVSILFETTRPKNSPAAETYLYFFCIFHREHQTSQRLSLQPCFNFINTSVNVFKGTGDKVLQKHGIKRQLIPAKVIEKIIIVVSYRNDIKSVKITVNWCSVVSFITPPTPLNQ